MNEFLKAVQNDTETQSQLSLATMPEDVMNIAANHGFTVTREQVLKMAANFTDRPLSEQELTGVAAGRGTGDACSIGGCTGGC